MAISFDKVHLVNQSICDAENEGKLGEYKVELVHDDQGHRIAFNGTYLNAAEVDVLFSELSHACHDDPGAFEAFYAKCSEAIHQKESDEVWLRLGSDMDMHFIEFQEVAYLHGLISDLEAMDPQNEKVAAAKRLVDGFDCYFNLSGVIKMHEILLDELIRIERKPDSKYAAELANLMMLRGSAVNPNTLDRGNFLHLAVRSGDVGVVKDAIRFAGEHFTELANVQNRSGAHPLMIAVGLGHLEIAQLLIDAGADVNYRDRQGFSPLLLAASLPDTKALEFCLRQNVDLSVGDYEGKTALHLAAMHNYPEHISILLERCSQDVQDYFGQRPLELAERLSQDEAILALGGQPKTSPIYGKQRIPINQGHILGKLRAYLKLKGRDSDLLAGGHCNGFAFLNQYYTSLGQEESYFKVLELISTWDGTEDSLKNTDVSQIFGDYSSFEELMEQWANDLTWFMHVFRGIQAERPFSSYVASATGESRHPFSGWFQTSRLHQFEVVRPSGMDLDLLFPARISYLSEDQIAEVFEIFSAFDDAIIEIAGDKHAVSSRVLEDGFTYYDSNPKFRMRRFVDAKDFTRAMVDTKYKGIGVHQPNLDLVLQIYFSDGKGASRSVKLPDELYKRAEEGGFSMHYTPLHLAVIANDMERFEQYVNDSAIDHNQKDANAMRAIDLAVWLDRGEMLARLQEKTPPSLPLMIQRGNFDLARTFFSSEITLSERDILDCLIDDNGIAFLKDLLRSPVSLMLGDELIAHAYEIDDHELIELLIKRGASLACPVVADPLVVSQLYCKLSGDIDARDRFGNTLLHYAVMRSDQASIEYLLEQGADPTIKNHQGKAPAELATSPQIGDLF